MLPISATVPSPSDARKQGEPGTEQSDGHRFRDSLGSPLKRCGILGPPSELPSNVRQCIGNPELTRNPPVIGEVPHDAGVRRELTTAITAVSKDESAQRRTRRRKGQTARVCRQRIVGNPVPGKRKLREKSLCTDYAVL